MLPTQLARVFFFVFCEFFFCVTVVSRECLRVVTFEVDFVVKKKICEIQNEERENCIESESGRVVIGNPSSRPHLTRLHTLAHILERNAWSRR